MAEQSQPANLLQAGATELGISLDAAQHQQFDAFARGLLAWNERAALTSITEPRAIAVKHFVDSLTAAPLVQRYLGDSGGALVDVGAGGGLPGLALAIAFPDHHVTLIEATGKKAEFLEHVIRALNLRNATVILGRAEEVANRAEHREQFGLAISRAVGSVAALIELLVPLIEIGGRAVLMKTRAQALKELEVATPALQQLNSHVEQVADVPVPINGGDRVLVVVYKDAASPERYPRRSGLPQRRPLVDH